MINRYQYTPKGSRSTYNTSKLLTVPKSSNDRYIFSREGDRLDLLAAEFYDDPTAWFILAVANNLGKGSLHVPAGVQIRIPDSIVVTQILDTLRYTQESR